MTHTEILGICAGSFAIAVLAAGAGDRPVMAAQGAASAPPPLDAPLPLPDAPGKVLVERLCKGCHEAAIVMTARETREGWETVVADMVAKGTTATPAEREIIVDYLAEHRGRGARADARGQAQYVRLCQECHGADGRGMPGAGPGLAGSPLAVGPAADLIRIVLRGREGRGGRMSPAPAAATDEDLALAVTYVRRSWGHSASVVTPQMIAEVRRDPAPR